MICSLDLSGTGEVFDIFLTLAKMCPGQKETGGWVSDFSNLGEKRSVG